MIYKTLEDVKRVISSSKPQHVIDMFISSYLQEIEYIKWLDIQKTEHEGLYPKQLPNPDYVEPVAVQVVNPAWSVDTEDEPYLITNPDYVEPLEQYLDNPDYIEFDIWMQETQEVESGQKDIFDEDGFTVIGNEPIFTDEVIRVYVDVPVDVEAWKLTAEVYKTYLVSIKDAKLADLTVITSTGKTFYADASSRSDLTDAVLLGSMNGITETAWKLAKEFEGQRVVLVSIEELAEASYLALQRKGQIVGAI